MGVIAALRRRSSAERRLLAEAALLLPFAAAAIRMRPFAQTVAFGAVPLGAHRADEVRDITRAVAAAARHMPFRSMCFEQGLAVQRMLRRRGQDARLHYGIAPGAKLEAHVWISLGDQIIHGGETAPRFREVGQWP
ncbi:hypothetical protein GCM10022280_16270 [Sphingomonas swuensis]|uniref:Microcin J25-processing protein McjB C-terminal domain-containing protein n=1 Tax=Sphingomonas swuensis TaxID=977800 RepID=A0ABP7SX74_9SPHN